MTENVLQKLEEKTLLLVGELEEKRKELEALIQENQHLKAERDRHAKKLNDLVSLLDVVNNEANNLDNKQHQTNLLNNNNNQSATNVTSVKPVLLTETVGS